jgi:hypothetical protein
VQLRIGSLLIRDNAVEVAYVIVAEVVVASAFGQLLVIVTSISDVSIPALQYNTVSMLKGRIIR